jgi:hypothetical protein
MIEIAFLVLLTYLAVLSTGRAIFELKRRKSRAGVFKNLVEAVAARVAATTPDPATQLASILQKIEEMNAEITEGQSKLAELLGESYKSNIDYLNKSNKQIIDSVFDCVKTNTDDGIRLQTENSQRIYNSQVLTVKMVQRALIALGVGPTAEPSSEIV